jgi:hypothetical protein
MLSIGWMDDYSMDGHWNVQATVRFAAGSVYFVRLGSGVAGRLGMSC